ncbi:MAG: trypsin-like peptidase domain-containing protein [Bacteroidota bacterium]
MYKPLYTLITTFLMIVTQTMSQEHATPVRVKTTPKYLSQNEKITSDLYEKVIPTVVTIFTSTEVLTQQGPAAQEGLGSGVLMSHECHILTAAHVVEGASRIMVKTQDEKLREAEMLFSEATADIALLKLKEPDESLAHAKLGNSDQLAVGQSVFAIGSPYGLEHSFSSGIISAFRDFDRIYDGSIQVEFIQTDAAINSGNSGGPLFNSQGEVIGIASSILTVSGGFQGIGMMVSINTAKELLAFEERPWIGVESFFFTGTQLSQLLNIRSEGGLIVQRVTKGSPADKAGIRGGFIPAQVAGQEFLFGGDIILEFGEQEACHKDCLVHAREQISKMDQIKVKFLREGKVQETTIDVSETRRNFLDEE